MARVIDTSLLTPDSRLDRFTDDAVYNGLDCCVTLEVLEALQSQLTNTTASTYAFSMSLAAPVLEMNLHGVRIDRTEVAKAITSYREDIAHIRANLDYILKEGVGYAKPWTGAGGMDSRIALMEIFYDVLRLPPVRKRNAQGKYVPTVNRQALEKLKTYTIAEPIVKHILAMRDLGKKIAFLFTQIDPDGRIRTQFNIGGTVTGRLSSAFSAEGTGSNLQNVERRLRRVFIPDPGYKFCNVDLEQADARNIGVILYNLFTDRTYLDACNSGDLHTTICKMVWPNLPWTENPKEDRKIADEPFYRDMSRRDTTKRLGHGCLTPDHEVLTPDGWVPIINKPTTIMTWDGNKSFFDNVSNWTDFGYAGQLQKFEGNSISACMTHDHRIPFKRDTRQEDFYVTEACNGPQAKMPLGNNYIGGNIEVPARLIAAFMADGHQDMYGAGFHFKKMRKIARLISLCKEFDYEYADYINSDGTTKINVKAFNWPKHPGPFMFNWTVQCLRDFLDELKYWDGHISATAVRISSTKLTDLEWFQTFGRILGIGGQISGPHTSGFGSQVYTLQQNNRMWASGECVNWRKIYVEAQRVLCPTVPSSWFYVKRNGKIFITGNSNYLGTASTMSINTKIPLELVKEFQRLYFERFPNILEWHKYVRFQLKQNHSITTLLGRRRNFFGRPDDEAVIREAVAFEPQSMTADEIDQVLLRLWRSNTVEPLLQVHDSILFQYKQEQEQVLIPQILASPFTFMVRDISFFVPMEAKVGWNWADVEYNKDGSICGNPNGLIKYRTGGDVRNVDR